MKRPVVWAVTARGDYRDIIRYIAVENPFAAKRIANRLTRAAANLADLPAGRAGRVSGTYEKPLPGLPYILAYRMLRGSDGIERVTIIRIIHGARNWPDDAWPDP